MTLSVSAVLRPPPLWWRFRSRARTSPRTVRSALDSRSVDFLLYSVDLTSFWRPFIPGSHKPIDMSLRTGRPTVRSWALRRFGLVLDYPPGPGLWAVFQKASAPSVAHGVDRLPVPVPGTVLEGSRQSLHPWVILPAYIVPHLPLLASTRTLSRFVVPLTLLTIVVGCLVLKVICQARPRGWTPSSPWACWWSPPSSSPSGLIPISRGPPITGSPPSTTPSPTRPKPAGVLLDLPLFSHSGSRSEGRGQTRSALLPDGPSAEAGRRRRLQAG